MFYVLSTGEALVYIQSSDVWGDMPSLEEANEVYLNHPSDNVPIDEHGKKLCGSLFNYLVPSQGYVTTEHLAQASWLSGGSVKKATHLVLPEHCGLLRLNKNYFERMAKRKPTNWVVTQGLASFRLEM
ncbi:TPA: hypothetical protein ACGSTL_001250 [Vibrio parahaemolyticus]|jgi:hypothetical protein|uniref:hypothetical protein n=1 Tax=Vibrio campbellii TaxID=680 RepID=UPI001F07778B|nr:hypothetical protein [Vibrio campbellii]UMM06668.1 hypothetical protein MKR81_27355 [Vibrio campbellii]